MKIASSNPKKLDEYKKLFPELTTQIIPDMPEVVSDKDTVILHKVKDLNSQNLIIEDTIIEIFENDQWVEVVDIKYRIKQMQTALPAKWVVSLGYIKEGKVYISRATLSGKLDPSKYVDNTFGFDSIFIPDGETTTLYELDKIGQKDKFNMRKEAMIDLKSGFFYLVKTLASIEPWTGKYQS